MTDYFKLTGLIERIRAKRDKLPTRIIVNEDWMMEQIKPWALTKNISGPDKLMGVPVEINNAIPTFVFIYEKPCLKCNRVVRMAKHSDAVICNDCRDELHPPMVEVEENEKETIYRVKSYRMPDQF